VFLSEIKLAGVRVCGLFGNLCSCVLEQMIEEEYGKLDYDAIALQDIEASKTLPEGRGAAEDIEALMASAVYEPADVDNAEENLVPNWDAARAKRLFRKYIRREERSRARFEAWQAEEARRAASWAAAQEAEAAAAAAAAAAAEPAAAVAAELPPLRQLPPAVVAAEPQPPPFSRAEDAAICEVATAATAANVMLLDSSIWEGAAAAAPGSGRPRTASECQQRFALLAAGAAAGKRRAITSKIDAFQHSLCTLIHDALAGRKPQHVASAACMALYAPSPHPQHLFTAVHGALSGALQVIDNAQHLPGPVASAVRSVLRSTNTEGVAAARDAVMAGLTHGKDARMEGAVPAALETSRKDGVDTDQNPATALHDWQQQHDGVGAVAGEARQQDHGNGALADNVGERTRQSQAEAANGVHSDSRMAVASESAE
jgi:hypothetical protein